jgi:hypothetical protein
VRELHASRRHRLVLHLPFLAGIAPVRWLGDRVVEAPEEEVAAIGRADVKAFVHGVLNRITGPDAVAGVQLASSGGGRGPAVAALLGLCLSGGAGTYCLATGGLPDPVRLVQRSEEPKHARKADARRTNARANKAPAAPTGAQADPPHRPVAIVTSEPDAQSKTEPRGGRRAMHEPDPRDEFGFEGVIGSAAPPPSSGASTATASSTTPASPSGGSSTPSSSPPPTSGGEFLP